MSPGVEISRYDSRADEPLTHLLGLLWSPDSALNRRHLDWKYNQNPCEGSRVFVARSGGKIVAMRGFSGARYTTGTVAADPGVVVAGDLIISPDFRGRGVFSEIMSIALEELGRDGFSYILNFSANPAVRLGSLAAGWGTTEPVLRLRKLPRPEAGEQKRRGVLRQRAVAAARALEKSDSVAGAVMRSFTRWKPFAGLVESAADASGVACSAEPRPKSMAALLERTESDGRIRHVRDEAYFTWRFGSPLSSYRYFFLGNEKLDAYVVLQSRHFPMRGRIVRIADWAGINAEARRLVLDSALGSLPRATMDVWASSLTPEDVNALESRGFVRARASSATDYAPAILARAVASPLPARPWYFGAHDLLHLASWNIRLLDSDGT